MGTAVLEGMQIAIIVARDHDRHGAEARAAIAVGGRQLGLETEEAPARPLEDARLLGVVDVAIGIDPIGHAGEAFGRPYALARSGQARRTLAFVGRHCHCSSLTLAALITLCQRSISSRI